MRERPILFSTEMVRAIRAGCKTVTRRVAVPTAAGECRNRYGEPGDRLWVKERFAVLPHTTPGRGVPFGDVVYYADDSDADVDVWRPSIHMPRWASRLQLEVRDVRLERVQEYLTDREAVLEGVGHLYGLAPGVVPADGRRRFAELWDSINAARGYPWADNPPVWRVEFEVVRAT